MRKITKFILTAFLPAFFSIGILHAQPTWNWATPNSGANIDATLKIATDGDGNVIAVGTYDGSATFGFTNTISSNGLDDVFVAKYDSAGALKWVKSIGGPNADFVSGVAVDGNGDIYICGQFTTFNNEVAFFDTTYISGPGNINAFVTKYNSSGTVVWAKSFGSVGNFFTNDALGIDVDASGNSYVCGTYTFEIDLGNTTYSSPTSESVFLMKLGPAGNVVWSKEAGGYNDGSDRAMGIDYDGNSSIYLTGYYTDSIDFGNGKLTATGSADIFFTKFDTSGSLSYAKSYGGFQFDRGTGIAVNSSGEAFVTGSFSGAMNFGSFNLSSSVAKGILVGKLDATGSPIWGKEPNSAGGTAINEGKDVIVNPTGDGAIFVGAFQDTIQFGGNAFSVAPGGQGGYIARYNENGSSVYWALKAGTRVHGVAPLDINCVVGGAFRGTENFSGTALVANGVSEDAFLGYISQNIVGVEEQLGITDLELFPNPAAETARIRFDLPESANLEVTLLDLSGRRVKTVHQNGFASGYQDLKMDLNGLQSGIYIVQIVAGERQASLKLSVVK
ncbi:MAG: T9SS type A sorting domain-containing protein [Bacteroidia bacterium]|nr:T9SS type A sorting domain-containing protein [Bacteroidia bacterium]